MKRFKQRGLTSLMVLLFMVVALTFMLGLSAQSMGTLKRAQNDADAALALQGAQRAAEYRIVLSSAVPEGFMMFDYDMTAMSHSFTPGSTAHAIVQPAGGGRHWVTGTCTVNGTTKSVRMYVMVSAGHGVWDNALFVRDFVDVDGGGLNIHGSVHLLGDNLDGQFAYDVSGNSYVKNNYSGMPLGLEGMIPPLEIVNGQETLGAEFRVRNGKARFKGLSTLGEAADPDGGASKGFLDGVFTPKGITGNVYSDNGGSELYDFTANPIEFPTLVDPYVDNNGFAWAQHKDFLEARSLPIPVESIDLSSNFEYGPDIYGNWIKVTPGSPGVPALLEINGIIKVSELEIEGGVLEYRGKGTFYSTSEINIEMDVVPAPGEVFPTTTALGFIATTDFEIEGDDSNNALREIVGAFYGGQEMEIEDLLSIAGTLVARDVDIDDIDNDGNPLDDNGDGGIPAIYQVPSLADNLPPGMPGANRVGGGKVTVLNWRKRSYGEIIKLLDPPL